MRKYLFALLLILSVAAQANENYQKNPPEVKAVFANATPVGTGVLRQVMLRAYEAAFWSKSGTWDAKEPYALSLTYFWEIEADDIVARTMKEIRHVRPDASKAAQEKWEASLHKVIAKVYDGERITAIWNPATKTTTFYHNDAKTGVVSGADFADAFFAIWLDEATTAPELRANLLKE